MRVKYKGFEIEVFRDCDMLFYSVFTEDGFECDSGFNISDDSVRSLMSDIKKWVDEYSYAIDSGICMECEGEIKNSVCIICEKDYPEVSTIKITIQ